MASAAAHTPTTDQLQEIPSEEETHPPALGHEDNIATNTTESPPQPEEDVPQVPSHTENTLPDPVGPITEAPARNLDETSRKGSSLSSSSPQKRPSDKVKSVDVGSLLQAIEGQLELQKTFEKQLELATTQLELLQQMVRVVGGTDKIEKPAATTESPRKLVVEWDSAVVDEWQIAKIPTNEKLDNMRKFFAIKDEDGSFYARSRFPRIAFTDTNSSKLCETPWPKNGTTEQAKFLARIEKLWPKKIVDEGDTSGWHNSVAWDRDGHPGWAVIQCNYASDGLPKLGCWERWMSGCSPYARQYDDFTPDEYYCPTFGLIIVIDQAMERSDLLPFTTIALVLSQLISSTKGHGESLDHFDDFFLKAQLCSALGFLSPFTSSWTAKWGDTDSMDDYTFHSRYIDAVGHEPMESGMIATVGATGGIKLERERGQLPTLDDVKKLFLVERRSSFKLLAEKNSNGDLGLFSIIAILHDEELSVKQFLGAGTTGVFAGNFSGAFIFFFVVTASFNNFFKSWDRVLSALDEELRATITDVVNENTRAELMFDDNKFARSKLYFGSSQLLRMFLDWIRESQEQFEKLFEDAVSHLDSTVERDRYEARVQLDKKPLLSAMNKAAKEQKIKFKALLDRIEKKQSDTISLRDGLFNATSVREATRSTRQNQYIFIFTVVTVFFTPLSFVTGFFGMHLFDSSDHASTIQFSVTFVLVALGTYALSALGFIFVFEPNLKNLFSRKSRERGRGKLVNQNEGKNAQIQDEQHAEDPSTLQSRVDSVAEEKGRRWCFSRRRHQDPGTEHA